MIAKRMGFEASGGAAAERQGPDQGQRGCAGGEGGDSTERVVVGGEDPLVHPALTPEETGRSERQENSA